MIIGTDKSFINALADVMRHQYWKEKDLVGALAFARAGIQFGLQAALDYDLAEPGLAYELRSAAKALHTISPHLPGWDGMSLDWK